MHDQAQLERLYKSMLLIREVEAYIARIYSTDAIKSPVHLSIGQEATAVGVCDAMNQDDILSHTYRCHATYLAKGGDLPKMMAELYGKRDGCAGGKAGSMHLIDMEHGVLGASAVVGTTIPIAVGYAMAMKREAEHSGKQRVVVCFFGDGATEEGCFIESINFAALRKIPVLFVCENNRLAIHTPLERRWSTEKICERVATYNLPTYKVDDGDVLKIREATLKALEEIRAGKGPVFMELATYRWLEHVGPGDDHHEGYRDQEEYKRWKEADQIKRLADQLGEAKVARIQQEVSDAIQEAIAFAEASPYPTTTEDLYRHVYA